MTTRKITGVILAGGKSKRMGNMNKCLAELWGKPLIEHVLDKLSPQVDEIIISTGDGNDKYPAYHFRQIIDNTYNDGGPLVGIYSAMLVCNTDYLLVASCDAPYMPNDLGATMTNRIGKDNTNVCMLSDSKKIYPLPCLLHRELKESLKNYLDEGNRKVVTWLQQQSASLLNYPDSSTIFTNINTSDDLTRVIDNNDME